MSKNNNKRGQLCADSSCPFQPWKSHTHRNQGNEKRVYSNILHAIGSTPLVKLNKIPVEAGLKCDLYVKVEFFNPGGSIKDRIGFRMVEDAEEQGRLKPGCTIIEPTSGNTGIGLAMACAVKGYKCLIVMPEKMSDEKVAALKLLGAKIIRTPTEAAFDDPEGLIEVAKRLNKEIPNSVVLDQYANPGNPLAHYDGTAEEILRQCDGEIDMVVVGSGTGGTITGISKKLKEHCPNVQIVGIDPEGSILSLPESLNETDVNFYEVEGIGYDFIPKVCHRDQVDRWIKTNDKMAFPLIRKMIEKEAILAGASSGSALAGAIIAAKDLKEGQKCVVILPDGIRNYMSKFVSDNWMEAKGFKEPVNEHNHWWWNHKVAELTIPKSKTIPSNITCKDALQFMQLNSFDCVPIEGKDGTLEGFLSLKHLTKKVVTQNYQLTDPIEKAIFKRFYRVTKDSILGLVSRMLEVEEFVAVIDKANRPVGVIGHFQLLNFIAAGGKPIIANGSTNGHTNFHANGHAK